MVISTEKIEKKEGFAETFAQVLEKLAGKESDLEFRFKDLTIETAGLKTKLTGSILVNIAYYPRRKSLEEGK